MPQPTGTVIHSRYRIVKLLGQGGFGAVYRAWDINLNQPVALKENLDMDEAAQRQFQREAHILAGLVHPNLPRVTNHFVEPGRGQYLVMDFVEGTNLEDVIAANSPLPASTVLDWTFQVSEALVYLHEQSPPIIHRDIKPANIVIRPDGRAMLVDFGLAKIYSQHLRTTVGARAVTPGYSPPEQYGHGNTDARADVYALAATMYHALTGIEPQESIQRIGGDDLAAIAAIVPGVPAHVAAAITQALALRPDQRYESTRAFRGALEGKSPMLKKGLPPSHDTMVGQAIKQGALLGSGVAVPAESAPLPTSIKPAAAQSRHTPQPPLAAPAPTPPATPAASASLPRNIFYRIGGVLGMRPDVFDDLRGDRRATGQARLIVILTGYLGQAYALIWLALSGVLYYEEDYIIAAVWFFFGTPIASWLGWFFSSLFFHIIGKMFFASKARLVEVSRLLGYSYAPLLLYAIPVIGLPVGGVWSFITLLGALRSAYAENLTKGCLAVAIAYLIGGVIFGGLYACLIVMGVALMESGF